MAIGTASSASWKDDPSSDASSWPLPIPRAGMVLLCRACDGVAVLVASGRVGGGWACLGSCREHEERGPYELHHHGCGTAAHRAGHY